MTSQEKETPHQEWPENFSPEIKRVLNKTKEFLANQYELKTEVNEEGVAFHLGNFSRGPAQLCLYPQDEDYVSVRLFVQQPNEETVLFESKKAQGRVIGGGESVLFDPKHGKSQSALLVDQHSIIIVLSSQISRIKGVRIRKN